MATTSNSVVVRFRPTPLWMAWAVSSSLALHSLAYFGLGDATPLSSHRPESQKSFAQFELTPKPLEPLPKPKPKPPEPEPPPKPVMKRPAPSKAPEPRESPQPAAPPEASEEATPPPAEPLSGLTLTSELGAGFAMPAGNGLEREGALRVPASLRPEPPRALRPAATEPVRKAPPIVAVKDLSARPVSPALDDALERNYPKDARSRGIGGTATVRVRIDADGVVRHVVIINESQPGFAEACRRTLRGSRWSAPRDRLGNAVATEIRYKCRFLVQP